MRAAIGAFELSQDERNGIISATVRIYFSGKTEILVPKTMSTLKLGEDKTAVAQWLRYVVEEIEKEEPIERSLV